MIRTILYYIVNCSDQVTEEVIMKAAKTVRNGDDIMNAMVKKWIDQGEAIGEAKGKAIGKAEARAKGIAEGRASVARAFILKTVELRFNTVPVQLREYIDSLTDLTAIEGLLPTVISSASLDDILRELAI